MNEPAVIESGWVDVGEAGGFPANEGRRCVINGTAVAVFRVVERFFALDDTCTHGRARLSDGFVENGCVECPLHQALFNLETGAAMTPPATRGVLTYPIRVRDGRVEIHTEPAA